MSARVLAIFRFQSTLSMRRATLVPKLLHNSITISIHALHEESDIRFKAGSLDMSNFNPRSP